MSSVADPSLEQAVLTVINAAKDGRLKIQVVHAELLSEILSAPRGMLGSVDTEKLSSEAKSFAKAASMALLHLSSEARAEPDKKLSLADGQVELFRLFSVMFTVLTGTAPEYIKNVAEIKSHVMALVQADSEGFWRQYEIAGEEIVDFYRTNASSIFSQAKSLGGLKLISGGQRAFLSSALSAVRITSLYADTQLIPDPVHPYFIGDLLLNARELQLAHTLYHILQLKPLIDARLPIPPVFVFPSFEVLLEANDSITKRGLEELMLRLLAPLCEGTIGSDDELRDYARKNEDKFVNAVLVNNLFVPPGVSPKVTLTSNDAIKRYFDELEGVRDAKTLSEMRKWPQYVVILNGIVERISPQFHLYDNANEFQAQPLLSQEVHWHYYEKCAQATAQSLVKKQVLSEEAFQTLRALQDDSLGWLASIPISGLVELNRNQEHHTLREEFRKCTNQLSSAGIDDLSQVVKEINHTLGILVQRQQKEIGAIQEKYAPKKWGALAGGAISVGSAIMLPALAPALITTAVGIAAGYSGLKAAEIKEKHTAGKSMLGMLALARSK